jgi:rod shape-determining protein MreD
MPMRRMTSLGIVAKLAVVLIAAVVLQGILAFKFKVFGYFDLPFICCIYYGFTISNPIASVVIGSSLGLMQDSLSGTVLGANGLSKSLIGFFAATAGAKFAVDQPVTRLFALFLFGIGDDLLVTILGRMVGSTPGMTASGQAGDWLISAVFNTLLGLVLFGYHDRLSDATA